MEGRGQFCRLTRIVDDIAFIVSLLSEYFTPCAVCVICTVRRRVYNCRMCQALQVSLLNVIQADQTRIVHRLSSVRYRHRTVRQARLGTAIIIIAEYK